MNPRQIKMREDTRTYCLWSYSRHTGVGYRYDESKSESSGAAEQSDPCEKEKALRVMPIDSSESHASAETCPQVPPLAGSVTSQTPNHHSSTDPSKWFHPLLSPQVTNVAIRTPYLSKPNAPVANVPPALIQPAATQSASCWDTRE